MSSVEQEVCCSTGNLGAHYDAVRGLIASPHITDEDRCLLPVLALPECNLWSICPVSCAQALL